MKGKEKNTRKSKQIKVAYSVSTRKGDMPGIGYRNIMIPKIKMEGIWLEKLGFHIGDRIVVEYGDGAIHITHAEAVGSPAMEQA